MVGQPVFVSSPRQASQRCCLQTELTRDQMVIRAPAQGPVEQSLRFFERQNIVRATCRLVDQPRLTVTVPPMLGVFITLTQSAVRGHVTRKVGVCGSLAFIRRDELPSGIHLTKLRITRRQMRVSV